MNLDQIKKTDTKDYRDGNTANGTLATMGVDMVNGLVVVKFDTPVDRIAWNLDTAEAFIENLRESMGKLT